MGKPFLDPGSLPLRKSCVCLSSVCRCLTGKVRPSRGHMDEGGVDCDLWNLCAPLNGAALPGLLLVATLALKRSCFFKKKSNFQIFFFFEVSLI